MVRHVRHLFTGLALAAGLSCSVFASAQTIYFTGGNIGAATGILGTITTSGVVSQVVTTSTELSGIAFSSAGVLYGVSADATTLFRVNQNTGALAAIGATGIGPSNADGLAFRSDGTLFLADAVSNLYTINPLTGAATLVGPIGNQSVGTIGFDGSGNLYETNTQPAGSNTLVRLNQATGAGTTVGNTAFRDIFGLAFSSGSLYGFSNFNNTVISINTATGLGTQVGTFNLGGGQALLSATAFTAVPEPSTLALMVGMGVTGTSVFLRRKRSKVSA